MHTGQSRRHADQLTSRRRRRGSRRSLGIRLGVVLAAFALIAVACGGGDDGGDTGDGAAPEPDTTEATVDEAPTTTLSEQEEEVVEAREAGEATGEDVRETETGPVHGGKLVYGIEADSANPFVHYATSCAISCRMIFRAITDSLYITDADGEIVPYLVESESHSDDYMVWTLTIRDGITFHDGTPLTGEAVAYNINLCRLSQLTGPAFLGVDSVVGEGQTVTVTASPGQPLAAGVGRLVEPRCAGRCSARHGCRRCRTTRCTCRLRLRSLSSSARRRLRTPTATPRLRSGWAPSGT
ncbi:ABC transporter substrate-binding protein [Candidatus Poriferisodalis sp.]|uniref:ABC transporter substrate-binding protein n=1 Tax=Candidatus Poriferisodalis sp. TaxID=3101277 RepID=UPI003B015FAE